MFEFTVERNGSIVGKYRKVHLPGHAEPQPGRAFQHLEKRYFEPGIEPFSAADVFDGKIGQAICNDRRWPEAFRVLALQGAQGIDHGLAAGQLGAGDEGVEEGGVVAQQDGAVRAERLRRGSPAAHVPCDDRARRSSRPRPEAEA